MTLLENKVFVVLQLTRGASDVVCVFKERENAVNFIDRLGGGLGKALGVRRRPTYSIQEATLYSFLPDSLCSGTEAILPFPDERQS